MHSLSCDSGATMREKDERQLEEEEEESSSLRQLTLDEWRSLQQDRRQPTTNFNIRKPGEGYKSDPSWNKMEVLRKKQHGDEAHMDSTGQFDDAVSM